jgi:hypothetical protein
MRCPDCNKFVAYDEAEPEISDSSPTVDVQGESASVQVEVRIVNNCQECGAELKEYTFDTTVDFDADVSAHEGEGHELSCEVGGESRDTDSYPKPKEVKDRKTGKMKMKYPNPRYTRTLYGFTATATLSCSCGELTEEKEFSDFIEASSMDELV